jgi:hypothetical protein
VGNSLAATSSHTSRHTLSRRPEVVDLQRRKPRLVTHCGVHDGDVLGQITWRTGLSRSRARRRHRQTTTDIGFVVSQHLSHRSFVWVRRSALDRGQIWSDRRGADAIWDERRTRRACSYDGRDRIDGTSHHRAQPRSDQPHLIQVHYPGPRQHASACQRNWAPSSGSNDHSRAGARPGPR